MPLPTVRSLYGLRVQTSVPVGVLPLAVGEPDVVVRYGPACSLASVAPRPGCFEARRGLACFATADGTVIVAQGGTEVLVERRSEADRDAVASLILGQVFAAILHQRRVLTLHASTVAVEGAAIAFIGDQGAGKTTVAATLCQRGGLLVTDDVLAITGLGKGVPTAQGGYPFLKVTAETAAVLGSRPEDLERAYASVPKWKQPATAVGGFPLVALYVLRWGRHLDIRRRTSFEAFADVARHSFAAGLAEATGTQADYLAWHSAFVRTVPVFDITRPRALDRVAAVADAVVAHAQSLSPASLVPPASSMRSAPLTLSLTS